MESVGGNAERNQGLSKGGRRYSLCRGFVRNGLARTARVTALSLDDVVQIYDTRIALEGMAAEGWLLPGSLIDLIWMRRSQLGTQRCRVETSGAIVNAIWHFTFCFVRNPGTVLS